MGLVNLGSSVLNFTGKIAKNHYYYFLAIFAGFLINVGYIYSYRSINKSRQKLLGNNRNGFCNFCCVNLVSSVNFSRRYTYVRELIQRTLAKLIFTIKNFYERQFL